MMREMQSTRLLLGRCRRHECRLVFVRTTGLLGAGGREWEGCQDEQEEKDLYICIFLFVSHNAL